VPGAAERVKVDLISGQYVGSEKADWIHVDELQINTLRGVDLALEAFEEITIEGNMPDGTHNVVRARIARAEAFVLIKAFALAERSKEKDAYDIAFVLQHYFPSVEVLAERMRALLGNGLAQQGYAILTEKFARIDSVGPSGAANEAERNGGDFEQVRRAAYEYAQGLFAAVAGLGT
jgi:hypothetical protein